MERSLNVRRFPIDKLLLTGRLYSIANLYLADDTSIDGTILIRPLPANLAVVSTSRAWNCSVAAQLVSQSDQPHTEVILPTLTRRNKWLRLALRHGRERTSLCKGINP